MIRKTADIDDLLDKTGCRMEVRRGTVLQSKIKKGDGDNSILRKILIEEELTERHIMNMGVDAWNARRLLVKCQRLMGTSDEFQGDAVQKLSLGLDTEIAIISKRLSTVSLLADQFENGLLRSLDHVEEMRKDFDDEVSRLRNYTVKMHQILPQKVKLLKRMGSALKALKGTGGGLGGLIKTKSIAEEGDNAQEKDAAAMPAIEDGDDQDKDGVSPLRASVSEAPSSPVHEAESTFGSEMLPSLVPLSPQRSPDAPFDFDDDR